MKIEPFGYFKAEPFGWTDCAETDDGAVALYDQSEIDKLEKDKDSLLDALKDIESATRHFHPCESTMEKVNNLIKQMDGKQ